MIPYGYGYFTYLQILAVLDFLDVLSGVKWWQDWVIFSFRRATVGFTLYGLAITLALFPVISWVTLPLLAWLALADYYDYVYMVSPWMDRFLGETIEFMNT